MNQMKLKCVNLGGYKSINPQGESILFGDVTILLGANGSGKSNLVSFFRMLNYLTTKSLQVFIENQGSASSFLYYGAKTTKQIDFGIMFEQCREDGCMSSSYEGTLSFGMPDRLFLSQEKTIYHNEGENKPIERYIKSNYTESGLPDDNNQTASILFKALSQIRAYQFHDTSDTAKIRINGYIDDCRYLRSDAGNLAAFLRAMKINPDRKKYYERIVRHIQKVFPQFKDFELEINTGNDKYLLLNWYDITGDLLFGPHQISDGSLRFMALATLLLQPPEMLPGVIVIDEPELGLHPAAIAELAGMIRTASKYCQIIIATQSTRLIDEFDISQIVAVEIDEDKHCSYFKRLDEEKLKEWIARYSLSELWEKNVLGGRP